MICFGLFAQSVTIDNIDFNEVKAKAFNLSNDTNVKIEGVGAALDHDWQIAVYYGWIVNTETQEVAWHLFDFMDDNEIEVEGEFDFSDEVNLSKGDYELYYASGTNNYNQYNNNSWDISSFNDVVKKVLNSRSSRSFNRGDADDAYIQLSAKGLSSINIYDLLDKKIEGAVFSFNRIEDDDSMKKGFSLKADTDLKILSVGEGDRDESFDYLVIYDAATREPVLEMDYRNAEFGGGAKKNMLVNEVINLKKGDYIAQYVSDDSHSFDNWNALPPDNPFFWGATVWPATSSDAKNVVPYRKPKVASPILELTKIGDDELVSQGLSVKSDMDVRVICLGEGSDDLVDYGWIVNASTRERVWEMKRYKTAYAGGAEKNRRVSEVISLEAGDYIVYYSTDNSHSYDDWNSTPPREEELWGITLLATNEADLNKVSTFDPRDFENKNTVAEILMVGNDERISESFTLNQTTRIRIIATGEGSDGDMYDYAYIRGNEGRRVWEMEYRDTDHAGGARKNRSISEVLTLEKGTYRLTYRSDGSHSYKRWNASPPSEQEMWGVILLKED